MMLRLGALMFPSMMLMHLVVIRALVNVRTLLTFRRILVDISQILSYLRVSLRRVHTEGWQHLVARKIILQSVLE
jgi:hypothetical protein